MMAVAKREEHHLSTHDFLLCLAEPCDLGDAQQADMWKQSKKYSTLP